MKDIHQAASYLYSYLQDLNSSQQGPLLRAWREVMGEQYLGHAQIRELEGRTLIVEVDHPAWMMKLHGEEARIIAALGKKVSDLVVTKIRFVLSHQQSYRSVASTKQDGSPRVERKDAKDKPLKGDSSFVERADRISALVRKNHS